MSIYSTCNIIINPLGLRWFRNVPPNVQSNLLPAIKESISILSFWRTLKYTRYTYNLPIEITFFGRRPFTSHQTAAPSNVPHLLVRYSHGQWQRPAPWRKMTWLVQWDNVLKTRLFHEGWRDCSTISFKEQGGDGEMLTQNYWSSCWY